MNDSSDGSKSAVNVGEKGLKQNAIGFISSTIIGVASTAPGYSLAAVLGFVVVAGAGGATVGVQAPAIMIVAFIPMLFIATSYYYMNRADPDCGTTFSWVTKAMGPRTGWIGGWAIFVADIVVMANLAQIAGLYTFLLVGWDSAAESTFAVTAVGVAWIVIMTAIVAISIELSARTQVFLLGAEIITLVGFAVVALFKVYANHPVGSITPQLDWFSPFSISSVGAMTAGVLLAVFMYWGWDSAVTVNEETEDSARTPGLAAIVSTLILVGVYVLVTTAAQAYGGIDALAENSDDVLSALGTSVLGSPLDKILIIAVLTSAAASTQTTILPTARTALSMARAKAIPTKFGEIHPRFLTPAFATYMMGALSIIWYVGLSIVSENILYDSIASLGLMIAFYYGLTGFACVIYYRRELLKSAKNFFFIGVSPLIGASMLTYIFYKSVRQLSDPANSESGDSWLGLGPPLVIAVGFLILGIVLMLIQWRVEPEFFRRKAETVDPSVLDDSIEPANSSGGMS
ncbi:MAG: APC family permease [Thermoleophilaceae bacterium]|nr:APC family permease [Thermoleophilaceae bacterium]